MVGLREIWMDIIPNDLTWYDMTTFEGHFKNNKGAYVGTILFTKDEIIDFEVTPLYAHYDILANSVINETDRRYKLKILPKQHPDAKKNNGRFQITYKVRQKGKTYFPTDKEEPERVDYLDLSMWNNFKFSLLHDRYIMLQDGKIQTGLWFLIGLIVATLITNIFSCNKTKNQSGDKQNYHQCIPAISDNHILRPPFIISPPFYHNA